MPAKKRRKKTTRRKAATRRGRQKPFPQWALLGAGLLAGILIAGLVQLVISRTSAPESGLRNLVKHNKSADTISKQPVSPKSSSKQTKVPHFDFYTILPEIETVLPDLGTEKPTRSVATKVDKNISYILQAGSFTNFEDADRLKAKLALNGLEAKIQKISIENKGDFHRVRLGPYKKLQDLDNISRQLKQLSIPALRLRVAQNING